MQDEESRQILIDGLKEMGQYYSDGVEGDFEFLCEYLEDFDDY